MNRLKKKKLKVKWITFATSEGCHHQQSFVGRSVTDKLFLKGKATSAKVRPTIEKNEPRKWKKALWPDAIWASEMEGSPLPPVKFLRMCKSDESIHHGNQRHCQMDTTNIDYVPWLFSRER